MEGTFRRIKLRKPRPKRKPMESLAEAAVNEAGNAQEEVGS